MSDSQDLTNSNVEPRVPSITGYLEHMEVPDSYLEKCNSPNIDVCLHIKLEINRISGVS